MIVSDVLALYTDEEFVECEFDAFMDAYMLFILKDEDVDTCIEYMLKKPTSSQDDSGVAPVMTCPNNLLRFMDFGEDTGSNEDAHKYEDRQVDHRSLRYSLGCSGYFVMDGDSEVNSGGQYGNPRKTSVVVPCQYNVFTLEKYPHYHQNPSLCLLMFKSWTRILDESLFLGCVRFSSIGNVWYSSRSHSVVFTPENYVTNPKLLIKILMSFMFATPKEIGYNTNMAQHEDRT